MKFVAYETCDKLIWISGESYRDLNTIRKQVIPKNNMNRAYYLHLSSWSVAAASAEETEGDGMIATEPEGGEETMTAFPWGTQESGAGLI